VHIVDDDLAVRGSIALLLRSVGIRSAAYAEAGEFLAAFDPRQAGCLVLDIRMPRMSGLEVQKLLNERGSALPLIFVTGHGDVPMAVEAMRAGAFDFLQKPFNDDEFIRKVQKAIRSDLDQHRQQGERAELQQRYDSLTPRERDIAGRLADGAANKTIAIDLELSERTVEVHRANLMQKLGARGLAQLVQMMLRLRA
jgi:FixJ family two-component response regulator